MKGLAEISVSSSERLPLPRLQAALPSRWPPAQQSVRYLDARLQAHYRKRVHWRNSIPPVAQRQVSAHARGLALLPVEPEEPRPEQPASAIGHLPELRYGLRPAARLVRLYRCGRAVNLNRSQPRIRFDELHH